LISFNAFTSRQIPPKLTGESFSESGSSDAERKRGDEANNLPAVTAALDDLFGI
jgi:hypothetical protein